MTRMTHHPCFLNTFLIHPIEKFWNNGFIRHIRHNRATSQISTRVSQINLKIGDAP